MQTYQKTTSVIFTITLLFLLLSIFVKSYIVAIVGLVVGALVSWIPIVAFNQMFDDIARVLFSIPRESDVWWKWLLVFLFGLLIEGMLIASYIIYLKNLGTVPGTKEAFGVADWDQDTLNKMNYFQQNEATILNIINTYNSMNTIARQYSNNADVLDILSVFKQNATLIYKKLLTINGTWTNFKVNINFYDSNRATNLGTQYNVLKSIESYVGLCASLIKQMQSYGVTITAIPSNSATKR